MQRNLYWFHLIENIFDEALKAWNESSSFSKDTYKWVNHQVGNIYGSLAQWCFQTLSFGLLEKENLCTQETSFKAPIQNRDMLLQCYEQINRLTTWYAVFNRRVLLLQYKVKSSPITYSYQSGMDLKWAHLTNFLYTSLKWWNFWNTVILLLHQGPVHPENIVSMRPHGISVIVRNRNAASHVFVKQHLLLVAVANKANLCKKVNDFKWGCPPFSSKSHRP